MKQATEKVSKENVSNSCPILIKYSWVVQFISHVHPLSLKTPFEIELDPLDFNSNLELEL